MRRSGAACSKCGLEWACGARRRWLGRASEADEQQVRALQILRNLVRHDGALLNLFKEHPAVMGVRWGARWCGRVGWRMRWGVRWSVRWCRRVGCGRWT